MEIRSRHEYVAQVRCLEGGSCRILLRDEKAPERRHIGLNGGLIDGDGVARIDEPLGLTRQEYDVVPDDTDAYVMEIIIRKEGNVAFFFRQRVTFIAAAAGVEYLPATFYGIIDGTCIARDEAIER